MLRKFIGVALGCASFLGLAQQAHKEPALAEGSAPGLPMEIANTFVASGYMGDGELGKRYVQVRPVAGEKPRPGDNDNLCIKVSYQPGAVGWAGVYWLYPANNWGDQAGRNIRGSTKVTFWATGQRGGEVVEFKSGGVAAGGKKYKDSYDATLGNVALTKEWKRYEINLRGKDLSSVIGGFAWVATADANPGGLVFFLDDIRFEQ